ncbi:hypothetical protein [Microbacterium terricola]|uniref:DUF3618 domain-containing protein n=1 Tax=Microbacterium terricola TaxID=344163 RepID=A0ABM8DZY5_9MICO|nr:hypothetical protein [Microbacterium terricola]UYK41006.1 hypothetical protein OAU46_05005 [Microbacterium terricola]BDV31237.1 hypothetical protein Microterr_18970 [Microbacterium terricola]
MSDGNSAVGGTQPYGTQPYGTQPNGTQPNGTQPSTASDDASTGTPSTVDTVKDEAGELKDTAKDAAKDVAGTAKDEAVSVARETKAQAIDLYHQTRSDLTDQAATQQARLAAGLGALGDELGSMARNSDGSGLAADLVQRVSDRASGAASWLDSRDPAGVLSDVKAFARSRPVLFIGAALLAGLVAGRLTRALAANAKDEADAGTPAPATSVPADAPPVPDTAPAYDSPLYAESAARFDTTAGERSHERSDTL